MVRVLPYYPLILLIFHAVGLYLFLADPTKISLTPLNILLCAVLVVLSETMTTQKVIVFFIIALFGILIEWIGVHTGLLFGNYYYGDVLGTQVMGIPLLIGLNWLVIVVSASAWVFRLPIHWALKSMLAGLISTGVDALIEPVAIRYGFWIWENDVVPFYNYLCWFIFASLFAAIYLKTVSSLNKTALYLLVIWAVFFGVLNLN